MMNLSTLNMSHPPHLQGYGRAMMQGLHRLHGWYRQRQAMRQLRSMSDRQLSDIGIERFEIEHVVRTAKRDSFDRSA